jgi:hypothetical protein
MTVALMEENKCWIDSPKHIGFLESHNSHVDYALMCLYWMLKNNLVGSYLDMSIVKRVLDIICSGNERARFIAMGVFIYLCNSISGNILSEIWSDQNLLSLQGLLMGKHSFKLMCNVCGLIHALSDKSRSIGSKLLNRAVFDSLLAVLDDFMKPIFSLRLRHPYNDLTICSMKDMESFVDLLCLQSFTTTCFCLLRNGRFVGIEHTMFFNSCVRLCTMLFENYVKMREDFLDIIRVNNVWRDGLVKDSIFVIAKYFQHITDKSLAKASLKKYNTVVVLTDLFMSLSASQITCDVNYVDNHNGEHVLGCIVAFLIVLLLEGEDAPLKTGCVFSYIKVCSLFYIIFFVEKN